MRRTCCGDVKVVKKGHYKSKKRLKEENENLKKSDRGVCIKNLKDYIEKVKFSAEVPDYEDDTQTGIIKVDVVKVSDIDKYIEEVSETLVEGNGSSKVEFSGDVRVKDVRECVKKIQDFLMVECSSVVEDHWGFGETRFGYCTEELDEFLENILNSVK